MNSNDIDLQKLVFHKVLRVSRVEFDADAGAFNATIDQEMREALAHDIQRAKIEKKFGDSYIEAELDLYVATPAEFWSLINYKAEQIALRWGRTVTTTRVESDSAIAPASVDKLLRENSKLMHAVSLLIEGCRHSPEGSKALSKWDAIRGE